MKKTLAWILALIMVLSLCTFIGAMAEDVTTIYVWSDNAHEKELRNKQIEEFNNGIGKEKGIYIEYTVYGGDYSDSIKIAAKTDEAPDMFRADNKWMQDFVDAGYVVPLTQFPGSEELIAKYDGLLAKQYHIFNGEVYTLPYNLTTYKFVVNVDLFKAAGLEVPYDGWTWAQVREYAQKITEANAGKAYGFGLSLKSAWTLSSYLTMPAGCNIGHYGYDWNGGKFNFAALTPMLEVVYNMAQVDGSVFPGFEGLDGDGVRAQFSEGRIGIMGAASFDAAVYNEQFPAKCEWAVVPEPCFTEEGHPFKEFVQPNQLLKYTKYPYAFDKTVYDKRVYFGYGKADPDYELKFGPNIKDWPEQPALTDDLLVKVCSYITDHLWSEQPAERYGNDPGADRSVCRN